MCIRDRNIVGVSISRKVTTSSVAPCGITTRNGSLLCLCGLGLLLGLLLFFGNIVKALFPNVWLSHLHNLIKRLLLGTRDLGKLTLQPSIFLNDICMIIRNSR